MVALWARVRAWIRDIVAPGVTFMRERALGLRQLRLLDHARAYATCVTNETAAIPIIGPAM